MKMNKKNKAIAIICVVALAVTSFMVYWKATERSRFIKRCQNDFIEYANEYRNDQRDYAPNFTSYLFDEPDYRAFMQEQVQEMMDNREADLLEAVLQQLERYDDKLPDIRDVVQNSFDNDYSITEKLDTIDKLSRLEYYNIGLRITRDSMADYLAEHGEEKIYTEANQGGYYDGNEDSSSSHRVGIENSPLYDAQSETFCGDFRYTNSSGVRLNSNYQESSYNASTYWFKDNYLDFDPRSGECVYSGGILFCFDKDTGTLIGFAKIKEP